MNIDKEIQDRESEFNHVGIRLYFQCIKCGTMFPTFKDYEYHKLICDCTQQIINEQGSERSQ